MAASKQPETTQAKRAAKVSSGPDLSGTWTLNLAKSNYGALPAPHALSMVIRHSSYEVIFQITQEVQGQQSTIRLRYLPDGSTSTNDVVGTAVRSTARWEGASLVVSSQAGIVNQGTIESEDRFTLSPDGKTLTQLKTIRSGTGAAIRVVFDRQ